MIHGKRLLIGFVPVSMLFGGAYLAVRYDAFGKIVAAGILACLYLLFAYVIGALILAVLTDGW